MAARKSSQPPLTTPPPAREKHPAGLNTDLALSEYGRAILRLHFDALLRNEAGTRLGQDILALHDMRVAARRLRAVFDVFAPAFCPRSASHLLHQLRAVRRALGPVRDLDVFIENARQYEEKTGLSLQILITSWQRERQTARQRMLVYLDSAAFETFKADFGKFIQTPGLGARADDPQSPHPQLTWQAAPLLIYERYADLLACDSLIPQASPQQLHDLRIRFKKLRYAVESFRELLGQPAALFIADLKIMQDHLGNLNDAHLACELLSGLLARLEAQAQKLPFGLRPDLDGIQAYLTSLRGQQRQLSETFPSAWAHFNRPACRQNLALGLAEL